jgi:hypothetical protein
MQELCTRCQVPVVRLECFDGRERLFTAAALSNPDVPESERWYVHKERGAVHGGLVRLPGDEPYLTRHMCRLTRVGTGASSRPEAGRFDVAAEIAQRAFEPQTQEIALTIPGRVYSYRYPSSWAHIVAGADAHGLCGDKVLDPDSMSERELARLEGMRVCPRCRARNARHEAARFEN